MALLRLDLVLQNNTITLMFLFAGYSLCDEYTPVNGVYIINQQNIKSKILVEQVHLY